jgi:hypothetical protein
VAETTKATTPAKLKAAIAATETPTLRADRATTTPRVLSPALVAVQMAAPLVASVAAAPAASVAAFESQIHDQVMQSLRMQVEKGGGEATIELNPNFLGRMQVSVKVDRGVVSANVQADTAVVREWMSTHREELSQSLAQQGMRLDKLVIAEPTREQPARDNTRDSRQANREQSRQRRNDREPTGDTFEHDLQETV